MKKPTAFGKDSNYHTYAILGQEIGNTKNKKELSLQIKLFMSDDVVESQRASSVLHHVCDTRPELLDKYVDEFVYVLNHPVHDAGPRVAFRILMQIKIPEKHLGTVIDLAFKFLNDATTPVAIKVNAMYVIANHVDDYPDLIQELSISIKNQYSHQPYSFSACVRKISKQLKQRLMD